LRTWRLGRFPWLVFYVEAEERVEVWRVLHGARDIPSSLSNEDESEPGERGRRRIPRGTRSSGRPRALSAA
jgi:toxin ParE1/3/4